MPDSTCTFLINTANNTLHMKSVTRASLIPYVPGSVKIDSYAYNGTAVTTPSSSLSTTNGIIV